MATLLPNGRMQICGYSGTPSIWGPLVGGMIYTYAAGTSTPKATYTTAAANVQNENPVVLDARGEATIFWDGTYKVVVRDADDNILYTVDNVTADISASNIAYGDETLAFILLNNLSHVVDSIADLKLVERTLYTSAFVKGYYAAGDGGGGHYFYDSTDTTSTDNGGTIIVATDLGRWKLLLNGQPVSVLQFGAVPDFSTDSTTEIQAAIDWLGIGGGIVTIDGGFLVTDLDVNANVTLLGKNGAPSQSATGAYSPVTIPSVLVIAAADTLTFKQGARIDGCLILNQNYSPQGTYPLPLNSGNAVAAVAAFAGTAVTIGDGVFDAEIVNTMILGFEYGVMTGDGSGGAHFGVLLDHVFMDCTNGSYIYSGFQTDVSIIRDSRCEPFTTAHLADSTKNSRAGAGFFDATARVTYNDCRVREWAVGFNADNASTQHIGCVVINAPVANAKIGFYYSNGGLNSYNTSCLAWNCGSGGVVSDLPQVATELCGVTIQGLDAYNASPCVSADGLVYIVDGFYTITDSQFGNNQGYGAIKLGANADYGSVDNLSFYQTNVLPPIYGDAAALLKMRVGQLIYRDSSPTVQPLTWTPVLKAGASIQTVSAAYGHFTITNQHVTCYFDILMSAKVATGSLTIEGIPYTAANETNSMLGMGSVTYYANTALLTSHPTCAVAKNTAVIDLYDFAAGGVAAIDDTNLTATTRLVGFVTYRIVQ